MLAEQNFQELDTNRIALGVALETIEKLSRQQQEVLGAAAECGRGAEISAALPATVRGSKD